MSPAWVAAGAMAVLALLTVSVLVADGPLPGELRIVRWLQSLGEPVRSFAAFVRVSTDTEACLLAAVLGAVWLWRRHGGRVLPAIAIVLLTLLAVQPVTKELVDRQRPTAAQVDVRAEHTSMSYPSGHSLSTTATWGAASLYAARVRRRAWSAALAVPVVTTGVASSIQGVHWPSDALAGTIMGAIAAWWIVRTLLGAPSRIAR